MPDRRPPRRRSAQRPAERGRRSDPVRLAAYTVMRAVDDGAYANLELPKVLREQADRRSGRGVRDRAGLRRHADARASTTGWSRSPRSRPAAGDRRCGPRHAPARGPPAARYAGRHPRRGRRDRGPGPTGQRDRRVRVRQRGAAPGLRARPGGVAGRGGPARPGAVGGDGRADQPSRVGGPRPAAGPARSRQRDRRRRGRAARRSPGGGQRAAAGDARGPAGTRRRERAARGRRLARPAGPDRRRPRPRGPGVIPAVREGRAAVQDEGSQLVALALAAAPVEGDSGRERWLDLCAGPGGKAGLLAGLALERDADLVANEVNPNRTDLVRRTLAAVIARGRPGQVTVRTGDGREVGAAEPDAYDRVLVDAPCTGLGALRRRPEARWRRQPSDVPGLATLQRDLLTSALDATRPGGVVAYATCSPHLGETRFVVSDVRQAAAPTSSWSTPAGLFVGPGGRADRGHRGRAVRPAVAAPRTTPTGCSSPCSAADASRFRTPVVAGFKPARRPKSGTTDVWKRKGPGSAGAERGTGPRRAGRPGRSWVAGVALDPRGTSRRRGR